MQKLLLLFIPILFWSCETNPPITPVNPIIEYGRIQVLSNVADAKIFIDGNDTGKLSPDTLTTTVGNHIIELRKDGYDLASQNVIVVKNQSTETKFNLIAADKIVLIEDFANVSCVPCVTSNKILEQLTNHTFGRNKLIAIKYPTNFPSPVDPFFLANGPDCNARMNYYQIILAPTNIVGGQLRPVPSDSNDVKEKIYAELSEIPQFIIEVQSNINSNTYNI